MRQTAAKSLLLAAFLAVSAEGGWYAVDGKTGSASLHIEEDQLVSRIPLQKRDIPVVSVTLREAVNGDEYLGKYVVEVALARQLDSGDGYILGFDNELVGEIKTRGNCWVFGFNSIQVARRCIAHLRDHHRLEVNRVLDTTKI